MRLYQSNKANIYQHLIKTLHQLKLHINMSMDTTIVPN